MGCCGGKSKDKESRYEQPGVKPTKSPTQTPRKDQHIDLPSKNRNGPLAYLESIERGGFEFAAAVENEICVYNPYGKLVSEFTAHSRMIIKLLSFENPGSEGAHLFSAGVDKMIYLWKLGGDSGDTDSAPPPIAEFKGHKLGVKAICTLSETTSPYLISGARDNSVRQWDISTGQEVNALSIDRNLSTSMLSLKSSPHMFAQCSEDLTMKIWDIRTFSPVVTVPISSNMAVCMDEYPHGDRPIIVTGHKGFDGAGCVVKLFDVRKIFESRTESIASGRARSELFSFEGHEQTVEQVKFVQFGEGRPFICSVSKDQTAKIIDITGGFEKACYTPPVDLGISCKPHTGLCILRNETNLPRLVIGSSNKLGIIFVDLDPQFQMDTRAWTREEEEEGEESEIDGDGDNEGT